MSKKTELFRSIPLTGIKVPPAKSGLLVTTNRQEEVKQQPVARVAAN